MSKRPQKSVLDDDQHLSPIILQLFGAGILVVSMIFWMFTDRTSSEFVLTGMSLVTGGTLQSMRLKQKAGADE